ncbi:MAG: hypothetical protein WBN23_07970 [Woeseia sp.]|jgi:hypothetical protein
MPTKPPEKEVEKDNIDDDEVEDFSGDETIVMDSDDDDDDALDVSMEVNVEKLMAEMDKTEKNDIERKKEIRRRLEEIQERRSLDDTYSFDMYGED